MKKTPFPLTFMIILFVLFFNGAIAGMGIENHISVENIIFSIPQEVGVTITSPIDFFLIDFFLDKENVFLKAYVGNHPQRIYRNHREYERNEETTIKYNSTRWSYKDVINDTYSGEVVVFINSLKWPAYIQFWYNGIDEKTLSLINRIILKVDQTDD
jgi:hypothetical protein